MALVVKNTLPMQETQETWVQSLGQEDPLEEGSWKRAQDSEKTFFSFFKGETRALWTLKPSSHREEEAEDPVEKESLIQGGLREDRIHRGPEHRLGLTLMAGASTSSFPHRNRRRSRWEKSKLADRFCIHIWASSQQAAYELLWNTKPGPALTRSDLEDGAGDGGVKFQTRGGYFREWTS